MCIRPPPSTKSTLPAKATTIHNILGNLTRSARSSLRKVNLSALSSLPETLNTIASRVRNTTLSAHSQAELHRYTHKYGKPP